MTLSELMKKGGVYYGVEGATQKEVLGAFTKLVPNLKTVSSSSLVKAVLEREELMTTSVNNGMAIPHPRNPLIENEDEQYVSIAFLKQPIDWNALDGKPVDTLILIVSASAKTHLQTLSKITYFCRDEEFKKLLGKKASADSIIEYVEKIEKEWLSRS